MFFFIGVIMALIQGGYARRIKPGHHIKAVRMVGVPSVHMTSIIKINKILFMPLKRPDAHIFFNDPCFLFLGNHNINPSIYSHRAVVEYNDALRWLGVLLIW